MSKGNTGGKQAKGQQVPMRGGGILTFGRVLHWISDDGYLRRLDPNAKLLMLLLAGGPRQSIEELKHASGLPMTKTKAAYEIVENSGALDHIAQEFYGDQYDEAVRSGRWNPRVPVTIAGDA